MQNNYIIGDMILKGLYSCKVGTICDRAWKESFPLPFILFFSEDHGYSGHDFTLNHKIYHLYE